MCKEKTRKNAIDIICQVLGELILYIPLLVVSHLLNLFIVFIISMICLFIFKHFFKLSLHLNKWYYCMSLSYGIFTAIAFVYVGIGVKIPFMDNQPMLIVLITLGIAMLNAYAGEWQSKLISKPLCELTEEELRKRCRVSGIKGARIEFVVLYVKHNWTFGQIAQKLGYAESTLKDWSKICKQKLNIKSWEVDN